jgi:hypothetical protein
MQKQKSLTNQKFKTPNQHDFIKSFATNNEEEKASLIFDTTQKSQIDLLENFATKQDLKSVEFDLKRDIKNLEKDIQNLEISLGKDIKHLEVDLKKDMTILEINLKKEMQGQLIKSGSLMVILFTISPLLTEFLKTLQIYTF